MKTKLTKSQVELLETGTIFIGPNGFKYYYLPFWFNETLEKGIFERLHLKDLSEDFQRAIRDQREGKGYMVK